MQSHPPLAAATAAFALLLLLVLMAAGVISDGVHVSVMNRLGGGNNLTLHCRSKDNDLGQQTVVDGSEFGWDFSVNVVGSTLFYCDLGWPSVAEFHFDAYSFGRDYVRCGGKCLWIVAKEGMYGLNNNTGFWEYAYSWPK